jgi:hypothetical protein
MFFKFVMFMLSMDVNPVSDSIDLQIVNEEIRVKSDQAAISLELKLANNTDANLLLYNFNGPPDMAFKEESFFCNGQMSARCTIVIYDDALNPIFASIPGIPKEIEYKPISAKTLQDLLKEEQLNFREALQVVKKRGTMYFQKSVNIKHFKLTPGTYFLRLLYTSGVSNLNMLDQRSITTDESANNAEMFSGCVKSNFFKVRVE